MEERRIGEPLSILHGIRVARVAAYPRRRSARHLFARLNQREYRDGIATISRLDHLVRCIDVELADTSRGDVVIEKSARFLSLSLISRTLRRIIRAVLGAFESAMSRDRIERDRADDYPVTIRPSFFFHG